MAQELIVNFKGAAAYTTDNRKFDYEVEVRFSESGIINCDALFDYFIRAALAFGFQRGSIDDVIVSLANEVSGYEKETEDEDE